MRGVWPIPCPWPYNKGSTLTNSFSPRSLLLALLLLVSACASATSFTAGTWTPLTNAPGENITHTLLLTDGTVIAQGQLSQHWYKLTPDNTGSYINGTWSQIADLPTGYAPLYYASVVLPSGKVFVCGGEYNGSATEVWTNLGALYDPATNTWTSLTGPWTQVGDAACTVLPNGKVFLQDIVAADDALWDPGTGNFTTAGSKLNNDRGDEEGYTLLPDGTILTVDIWDASGTPTTYHSQRYNPSTDTWSDGGNVPQQLYDTNSELGPAVLMFDGRVWQMGATQHTAFYTPSTNSWASGPDFPNDATNGQQSMADAPACLLPNGNVLIQTCPGFANSPSLFYEFDGTNYNSVPATADASFDPSYLGTMLMLPTGQVLYTNQNGDNEVYTPSGTPSDSWRPTITTVDSYVQTGGTYSVSGTQFNGLSETSAYGDDSQNATNYPIVRITNNATSHVFYCKTLGFPTGVATGAAATSTNYIVPAGCETGASTIQVIANGIPSATQSITVTSGPVITGVSPGTCLINASSTAITVDGGDFQSGAKIEFTPPGASTVEITPSSLSGTELQGSIPSTNLTSAGTATVAIKNTDGNSSSTVNFYIRPFPTNHVYAAYGDPTSPTTLNVSSPGVLTGETGADTAVISTHPSHASAFTLNSDGSFSYTADPGFYGLDYFVFRGVADGATSPVGTAFIVVRPALQSVSASSNSVLGGNQLTGTVTLTAGDLYAGPSVSITFSDGNASVAGPVQMTKGYPSAKFTINTTNVAVADTETMNANYNGITKSTTFTINPITPTALIFSNSSILGGNTNNAQVTISSPAGPGGLVVTLSADLNTKVQTSVTVAAGHTTALFPVGTYAVDSDTIATITATAGGTAKQGTFMIKAATLASITFASSSVHPGRNVLVTFRLNGHAPSTGEVITLQSTPANAFRQTQVTVPAGATSFATTLTAAANPSGSVTLQGTGGGVTQSANITIN